MFERPHHRRIARVLDVLDAGLLLEFGCLFGGGTCIAMRFGEFRESVDMDFVVADAAGYRELRQRLSRSEGLDVLLREGVRTLRTLGELRIDQYGIRTRIDVDGTPIKFEIIREARITLDVPGTGDAVGGVPALTVRDLAASKLLANPERARDEVAGASNRGPFYHQPWCGCAAPNWPHRAHDFDNACESSPLAESELSPCAKSQGPWQRPQSGAMDSATPLRCAQNDR